MSIDLQDKASIIAVVVTYFPEKAKVKALLEKLAEETQQIIIVDNGSSENLNEFTDKKYGNTRLIELDNNTGIGYAINVGVNEAFKQASDHASTYIALFDHDSLPEKGMLKTLLDKSIELQNNGVKLAAVGANYLDPRANGTSPFVKLKGLRLIRESCEPGSVIPVDLLISSGSLIPLAIFQEVGMMDEALFIDYVDIEWSLRATNLNYKLYGIADARMIHELGDEPSDFFGKKIPVHSPDRDYYHFRNAIYLIKKPYASVSWKITDGYRLALKYFVYVLLVKPRYKRWIQMNKGIWHGLIGKMGKLSDS